MSVKVVRDTVGTVLIAVVLALIIRSYVVEPFVVDGVSMQNTLQNHERVLVMRTDILASPLHYGEIVVLTPPLRDAGDYIKRVIATGGQILAMRDGQVFINGREMPQPYLYQHGISTKDDFNIRPFRVPRGYVYVLGDHRADSEDSRLFGPVKVSSIHGVATWVIWPLQDFGPIRGY